MITLVQMALLHKLNYIYISKSKSNILVIKWELQQTHYMLLRLHIISNLTPFVWKEIAASVPYRSAVVHDPL